MNELNELNIQNDDSMGNRIWVSNDESVQNTIAYTNDQVPINERAAVKDNSDYSEFGTDIKEKKGETRSGVSFSRDYDITKIAATFTVVAVVAMAVVIDDSPFGEFFDPVTGIITEGFGFSDDGYAGEVSFSYLVTDTELKYNVEFSTNPGTDVRMKVTNTNTDRTIDLSESTSGSITGLKAGMKYSIAVLVGSETVMTKSVTTKSVYNEAPMFTLVYAKCYCDVDDSFHFKFDVVDRNGVWSNYSAKLVVDTGQGYQEFVCVFTDDLTGAQTISTVGIPQGITDATLVIGCTETSGGIADAKTLYSEIVKI